MSVVSEGELLHIVTRRQFENDARRHFLGRVTQADQGLVRVEGYAFVYHSSENKFHKHAEVRTRLFDIADSGLIVNVLPAGVEIDRIVYALDKGRNLVITDGDTFELDINEFGVSS